MTRTTRVWPADSAIPVCCGSKASPTRAWLIRPPTETPDMTYFVKEIFYTLQGEGTHAGRPAVFCRFSRCNLWTGYEKDRARAVCKFCDTDFVGIDGEGGGRFATADE